ncbi:adenylate cyclase [Pelomyxa schiedti]|nr:adenylate cyclase [Pelomyxa schiedti]
MFQRTAKVSDLSLLGEVPRNLDKNPCHFSLRTVITVFLLVSLVVTVTPVMIFWSLSSQAGLEKTTTTLYNSIINEIERFAGEFVRDATLILHENANLAKLNPLICSDEVEFLSLWKIMAAHTLSGNHKLFAATPTDVMTGAQSFPYTGFMNQGNSTGWAFIRCLFDPEPFIQESVCENWGLGYRPTLKDWFQLAVEYGFGVPIWTEPYTFVHGIGIGFTLAEAVPDPLSNSTLCAVFALDYDLSTLQAFFLSLSVGKTGWSLMFQSEGGTIIASGNENIPILINGTDMTSLWTLETEEARDIAEIFYSHFGSDVSTMLDFEGVFHYRGTVAGEAVDVTAKRTTFSETLGYWVMVSVVPCADYFTSQRQTLIITVCSAIGIVVLLGAIVVGASFYLTTPIKYVSRELEALSRLDERTLKKVNLGLTLHKDNRKKLALQEINSLEDSTESVRKMLASFGKYVPMEVVKWYLNGTSECKLGVRKRQCSIMFCDIEDFSHLTEVVPPEMMIALFTRFMDICHHAIQLENGIVDKIVGDEIMAVWGATVNIDNPDTSACNCAVRIQESLKELRKEHSHAGLPLLYARIGVASGEVLAGNSGSTDRFCYTVMGSSVNLASRLENLNKYYGSNILISETVYQNTFLPSVTAHLDFAARKLGTVVAKGMINGSGVYELLPVTKGDGNKEMCADFTRCTLLKEAKEFNECATGLQSLFDRYPEDRIIESAFKESQRLKSQKDAGEIDDNWSHVLHFNTKF